MMPEPEIEQVIEEKLVSFREFLKESNVVEDKRTAKEKT